MHQCPNCGSLNNKDAQFCATCGTSLKAQPEVMCGQVVPVSSKFCLHCGHQFEPETEQATVNQPRAGRKPPKKSGWSKVLIWGVIVLIAIMGAFSWRMYRQTQINTQNEQRAAQAQESKAQQASANRMKAASSSSAAERRANSREMSSRQSSLASASSSSVAAASSRKVESAKKADSLSTSESESKAYAEIAKSLRSMLVSEFGCDKAAVAAIPDKVLADMTTASSKAGEDIGGFYMRVKSRYPKIGGNILGPESTSSADDTESD